MYHFCKVVLSSFWYRTFDDRRYIVLYNRDRQSDEKYGRIIGGVCWTLPIKINNLPFSRLRKAPTSTG